MSNLFEVVDKLPAGRSGRHQEILDAFMDSGVQYAKLVDHQGVRTNTLTLLARQKNYAIKVHRDGYDIYLERTDHGF